VTEKNIHFQKCTDNGLKRSKNEYILFIILLDKKKIKSKKN